MSENALIIAGIETLYRDALSKGNQKIGFTYSRALKSLRACTFRITSGKEALKIDGVGKVIASKIDEILARTESSEHQTTTQIQRGFANVGEWLQSLGLECYREAFISAGYDNLVACLDLTDKDLDNINVITKPGHRKTLLNASRNLSKHAIAPNNTTLVTSTATINNPSNSIIPSSITSVSAELNPSTATTKASYVYKKNTSSSTKIPSSIKKLYPYIPTYRSGSWGILLAIYEYIYVEKNDNTLYKPAIVSRATKYSDASFSDSLASTYNAWSGMSTLLDHDLVLKDGNPAFFTLSDSGKKLAKMLFESLSSMKIEKFNLHSIITDYINSLSNKQEDTVEEDEDIILILDNREVKKGENNNLFEVLRNKNIVCEKRNLELGDITWIFKNKVTSQEVMVDVIIERKKIPDLASSIEDGRYKEQKFRLQNCGISRIVYLIEGSNNLINFEKQITETDAINNFLVQFTESEEHTVDYLVNLTNLIKSSKKTSISSNITYDAFALQASKSKNLTLSNLFTKQLTLFSGCTSDKANSIVSSYPTPYLFQNMLLECDYNNVENILDIEYGNKKRKLNTNLKKTLHNYYTGHLDNI